MFADDVKMHYTIVLDNWPEFLKIMIIAQCTLAITLLSKDRDNKECLSSALSPNVLVMI